jgi:hypothetical protein
MTALLARTVGVVLLATAVASAPVLAGVPRCCNTGAVAGSENCCCAAHRAAQENNELAPAKSCCAAELPPCCQHSTAASGESSQPASRPAALSSKCACDMSAPIPAVPGETERGGQLSANWTIAASAAVAVMPAVAPSIADDVPSEVLKIPLRKLFCRWTV